MSSSSSSLPANVRVSELPDGVEYALPHPMPGSMRLMVALGLIVASGVMMGFAASWISGVSDGLSDADGNIHPFGIVFMVFGAVFMIAGLVPALIGVGVAWGRMSLRVGRDELRVTRRVGPVRWSRGVPLESIRRFEVADMVQSDSIRRGGQVRAGRDLRSTAAAMQMVALRVEGERMRPLTITWSTDRNWLHALAQDLAQRCQTEVAHIAPDAAIEVVHSAGDPHDETPVEQPADSDATIEWHDAGFTLTIPPAGLLKGSHGVFPFGVAWLVFTLGIGGVIVYNVGLDELFPVVLLGVFLVVGVGMLVAGLNMGKRRAIIDVVGDTLLISRQSLFGTRQYEWTRDQLAAIRVDRSGMEVNNRPVMQLQIHPREGKTVGLLTQRREDELIWIAYLLRTTLHVPAYAEASGTPSQPVG